jgi:hypothetical protein
MHIEHERKQDWEKHKLCGVIRRATEETEAVSGGLAGWV